MKSVWLILLTILWIVMLGDMIGASLAAWKCWDRRAGAGRIGIAVAALLIGVALESLNQTINSVIHAQNIQVPEAYTVQWIAGRAVKAVGTWWFALVVLDD